MIKNFNSFFLENQVTEKLQIKCSNCGWKWDNSEAGLDPYTCHKCRHENEHIVTNVNESIPKAYLTAPTKSDKARMKAEIKKHSKKKDDDPSAYKDWEADYEKGDTKGKAHKTKLSPATIAYRKKFKVKENIFHSFEEFLLEKKNVPEWKDSDAPDAKGRFKELGIKDLAEWLIKTRKKDLKKISGSITQQIVFNRGKDPEYAEKMEKVRKEVYRQLGREDLLEQEILESKGWETALKNKSEDTKIPYRFLKKVYNKGLAAWKTGHRPGASQHQWAMARVNSWITGDGGARKADKDIWDDYKSWKKTNESVDDIIEVSETVQFPHEIKSEKFWRQALAGNEFALKVLDTVMKRQKGFASDRQMAIMRKVERGDTTPYHTKN